MRVLVIRLSHLGDVILTEPVVRSVKTAYPDAKVDFLTREIYRSAVGLFDGVDSTLAVQIPGRDQQLFALNETVRRMCQSHYDLLIDLHGNLRSWWIRLRLKADRKVTYPKNWRARRKAVRKKQHDIGLHTVDLYLRALSELGIPAQARVPKVSVAVTVQNQVLHDHCLERDGYCVFAVGASHPTKHFPITQWVLLAEEASAELGIRIVVVERDYYEYMNLFEDMQKSGQTVIHTGLDLPALAGLLASARLTVSNDSGIMHLSAATGTPTVGLFGPTHPSLGFSPLGNSCRAVTTDESCSPCSRHGASPCYRDDRYCFKKMSTDMIMKHVREVLGIESTRA